MTTKKTHGSSGADDGHQPDEISKKLQAYEERLARLFAELSELGADVRGSSRAVGSGLPTDDLATRRQAIGTEIRKVRSEMNELRKRTGRWYRRAGTAADSDAEQSRRKGEEEKLRLRRSLGKIADAQMALINKWNANPAEAKRADFEKEYRRLAAQYSEVRTELNRIRERLGDL